jgi:sugar lactone lactonase YvrE
MFQRLLAVLVLVLPALVSCGGGASTSTTSPSVPATGPTTASVLQPGVVLLAGTLGGAGNIDGTGSDARFADPAGISVDGVGSLYVVGDETIRRITPERVVQTMAGVSALATKLPLGLDQNTGIQPSPNDSFINGAGAQARLASRRLASDAAGTVFFTQSSTVRKMASDGTVSTLAGSTSDASIVDGPVATARFLRPDGITVDRSGNLYVTDSGTLRRISASGTVSTVVGTATATLRSGLASDPAGNVYATDGTRIYLVGPQGGVSVYAGSGTSGSADGAAGQAQFRSITDLAVAPDGNLYAIDAASIRRIAPNRSVSTLVPPAPAGVAEPSQAFVGITVAPDGSIFVTNAGDALVEKVAADGTLSPWAGRTPAIQADDGVGGTASFGVTMAVATDMQGNAYVLDAGGRAIRKVAPDGTTTTLVSASASGFNGAAGLALDPTGRIYVADTFNHAIRTVAPDGNVTSLAGVPSPASAGYADGTAAQAKFDAPHGIAVDATHFAYVADTMNDVIRKIAPQALVSTLAGAAGQTGDTDGVGSAARFFPPMRVFLDSSGNLLESGTGTALRRITPEGVVTTVAPAGANLDAQTNWYTSDSAGNVYGTDLRGMVLRKLAPDGTITTVAGIAGSVGVRLGPLPGSFGPIVGMTVLASAANGFGAQLLVLTERSVLRVTLSQ